MTASAPQQHDPEAIGARLGAMVDEAQVLIDQLGLISEQQQGAIREGDVERIVEVVAQRDPLVRRLVDVGGDIGALIENKPLMGEVSDALRDELLRRIANIEHAMKKIRERDARDQQVMESARDKMAKQLAGMGAGRTALRAYSTRKGTPNPTMQDRRG